MFVDLFQRINLKKVEVSCWQIFLKIVVKIKNIKFHIIYEKTPVLES